MLFNYTILIAELRRYERIIVGYTLQSNNISLEVQITKFLVMQFSLFSLLCPNILLGTLLSNTLNQLT
jgi:hypothetical protein